MRPITTTLALLCFTIQLIAQESGDQLFNESILHQIRITSGDENLLSNLNDTFLAEFGGEYTYTEVDVEIDGNLVSSVGARVKGGLTAFDPKKPLKIDFNEFVEGQHYNGVKKVNIHNVYFDESGIREALSYNILRTAGLKAPRTAYAEVYINDDLQGLYLLVEQIDKTFLQNYFADDSGVLYKDAGCMISVKGDSGTLAEYQEFESTLQTLTGEDLKTALSQIIDTEGLIIQLMLQNLMNTVDNIYSFNCNYYIYHEPKSDLLNYIPWDFNLSLYTGVNNELLDLENDFFEKLYGGSTYGVELLSNACKALNYNFTEERLFQIIDTNVELISEAIQRDPIITFDFNQLTNEIEILKNTITSRINTFQSCLIKTGFNCEGYPTSINEQDIVINEIVCSSDSLSGINDGTGSYPDWIELYNNTNQTVDLGNVYLSDDVDFLKHWAFPENTKIDAHSYLIIWADRDVDEPGLHADFKLSKFSGELYLVNEDNSLIDSVSYGLQETNIAYARVPNGSGAFKKQTATFSQSNNSTQVNSYHELEVVVYPNPISDQILIVAEKENITLEVLSMHGVKVINQKLSTGTNHVDSSFLTPGSYIIKLSAGDIIHCSKIVKH